jgi:hypothetical protein
MPVTITFHKVSEKKPEHGQSIIWLQNTSSFGYQGFNPREVDVEYQWTEYFLADKVSTGTAICYNHGDETPEPENGMFYEISIIAGDQELEPNDLWIDVEEYWKCFDTDNDA